MGPGDPFSKTAEAPEMQGNDLPGSTQQRPPMTTIYETSSKAKFILGGFILGMLFGIGVLIAGWANTLLVVICGMIGALLSWVGYGLANNQLNFDAAWRALRGK